MVNAISNMSEKIIVFKTNTTFTYSYQITSYNHEHTSIHTHTHTHCGGQAVQHLHKADNTFKLVQEPAVNASKIIQMINGIAGLQGSCYRKYPLVSWVGQFLTQMKVCMNTDVTA